jgi:hypothetical protein
MYNELKWCIESCKKWELCGSGNHVVIYVTLELPIVEKRNETVSLTNPASKPVLRRKDSYIHGLLITSKPLR